MSRFLPRKAYELNAVLEYLYLAQMSLRSNVYVCSCVHTSQVNAGGGGFLNCFLVSFSIQGLLLDLELTNLPRLPGQWTWEPSVSTSQAL